MNATSGLLLAAALLALPATPRRGLAIIAGRPGAAGTRAVAVAVLAVVLAGKGVAGLQEAGWLSASPIHWPRIEVLGIYPSAETTIAQAVILIIALAGFALNAQTARRSQTA